MQGKIQRVQGVNIVSSIEYIVYSEEKTKMWVADAVMSDV
ncbi:unnamed protein product [marine sediment metagenome]|uniref:Uncharacterized protein n=1 Tax=marine sediment metagenome TaxID=412755 RepID=X1V4Q6_9ZZZZ